MAEEFVIKIIPDGVSPAGVTGAAPGAAGGNAGAIGNMSKGFGGAMKALGIGSLVGLVLKIVSSFQGLMNMVGSVVKIISLIFKPVADAIMIILMPLIFLLKPVVMALNELMRPFIKLALQVMKQGAKMLGAGETQAGMEAFGGAAGIIMAGLTNVIVALAADLLKMVFRVQAEFLRPVLEFFGANVDNMINDVNSLIDTGAVIISAALGGYAAAIGETFSVDIDQFRQDHRSAISNLFGGSDGIMDKYGVVFEDTRVMLGKAMRNTMIDDPNSFMNTIDDVNLQLQNAAANAGNDLVSAFAGSVKSSLAKARASIKGKDRDNEVGRGGDLYSQYAGKTSLRVATERATNTIGVNPKRSSRKNTAFGGGSFRGRGAGGTF